ncbi:MAG: outer membrane receptor for ferrienterochelin and colicins, partial [Limisphaerales bacterium]
GAYIQGEYKFSDAFKLIGAIRGDYHDPLDEIQVSPRVALVYKPSARHTIRGTFNRAFNTPSTLNLSLDLSNGLVPNGINIRGIGNPGGYNYVRDENEDVLFMNPYDNQYYSPFTNINNNIFWNSFQNTLGGLLAAGAGLPTSIFQSILDELFSGMNVLSRDIDLVAIDYANVATGGDASDPRNQFNLGSLSDFGAVKSEITQTYELGYKGLLLNDRLFLNIDVYHTTRINPRTGLETVAPSIVYDNVQLLSALGADAAGGLLHDNLAAFESASADLYATLVASLDGQGFGSTTPNGSIHDEFLVIAVGGNNQLTLGTVSPENEDVGVGIGPDAILTYRNLDTSYSVIGTDIGFTFLATDDIALSGSFSYVSKDSIPVAAAAGGFVSLNAPKYKFSLGYDHEVGKSGITLGATYRWSAGFYANDAIYIGEVDPYNLLDLRVAYRPTWSPNTQFALDMSNALGKPYRTYPSIPMIGRLTMFRIGHTF